MSLAQGVITLILAIFPSSVDGARLIASQAATVTMARYFDDFIGESREPRGFGFPSGQAFFHSLPYWY